MRNRLLRKLCEERGTVFLEYALLESLVVIGGCMAIAPGSPIYQWLAWELKLRLLLICAPIF